MKKNQKQTKQESSAVPNAIKNGTAQPGANDAEALLRSDHRAVEQLFAQFKAEPDRNKKEEIVQKVCTELIVHTKLEEELFYPACREKGVTEDLMDEAQVEHDDAKILIAELLDGNPEEEYYNAKVSVLAEYIMHHVKEEEKPRDGIFAKAEASGVDMMSLGTQLQQRKQELMAESDAIRSEALELISLNLPYLDTTMPTNSNYRERDEEGRFMSDDDNRGGRSSRSRGEARGWYGDSQGHSMAAERGWDEREGGRSNYRSRDYDDDGYSRNGRSNDGYRRGHGGWFGDPEGHSEASDLGWERREGGDRGRSSYRSRDYDGDRGGRSRGYSGDRGYGGWFGDPEGHSEAAELGWERREGGRGGSNYRSRSHDDDRRSSRDGRGHGGWFGDPRGHSEAAREGWANR